MNTKKSGLILALLAVFTFSACTVSKSARTQRNLFSGTWSLDNVSYGNNVGNFQSVLFDDSRDICFEGSDWFFRDNNSTGRYTIKSGSLCQGGDRFFRWSVYEPENSVSQLQFKFIDEKRKDISGSGYRLDITNLTEQNMTLQSRVTVEGEPITVIYEFSKK